MTTLKQESGNSLLETVLEVISYPLLLLMPLVVTREMLSPPVAKPFVFLGMAFDPPIPASVPPPGVACPAGGPLWTLWTPAILVTLASVIAIFFYAQRRNLRDERPFSFVLSLFMIETFIFVPLIIVFRSFESFRMPQQTMLQITAGFLLLLFVIASAMRGRIEFRWHPLYISIGLMTAISLFSFVFSPSFFISLKDFAEYFCLVFILVLILHEWSARKHIPVLGTVVLTVAAVEALLGIGQHFGFNAWLGLGDNRDPFATLGNKNYNAELLAMVFPYTLSCFLREKKWSVKPVYLAHMLLSLFVILLTQTRGAWTGLALSSVFFYIFYIDVAGDREAKILTGVLFGMIAAAVLLMVMSQSKFMFHEGPAPYAERFFSIFRIVQRTVSRNSYMWFVFVGATVVGIGAFRLTLRRPRTWIVASLLLLIGLWGPVVYPVPKQKVKPATIVTVDGTATEVLDDSISSRSFIWGGTLNMIKHYPMGVGIGAYKVRYLNSLKDYIKEKKLKSIPGFFKDVNAKEAHNEYLHILSEMGPLGLLFLLLFIGQLGWFFLKHFHRCRDADLQLIILGSFSALVSIGGSAMFGFPFRIVPTAILVACLIAVFLFANQIVDEDEAIEKLKAEAAAKVVTEEPDPQNKKKKKKKAPVAPKVIVAPQRGVRVARIPVAAGLFAVVLAAALFTVSSVWAYNVQMAQIVMKRANGYAQYGNNDIAGKCYDESVKLDRYNGDVHLYYGMYYQRLHMNKEAVSELEEARSYFDLPMIYLNLGAILFDMGEPYYASAEQAFRESLGVFPNYPLPRYNLGLIYEARGATELGRGQTAEGTANLKKALQMFRIALKMQPNMEQAYYKTGVVYERMGDLDTAIENYKKSIKANPGYDEPYFSLGVALNSKARQESINAEAAGRRGDKAGAERLFTDARKLAAEAESYFDQATRANPNNIKALNNMGNIYFQKRDYEKAINFFQRALQVDPTYIVSRLNLALTLLEMKRYSEALTYVQNVNTNGLTPDFMLKIAYITGTGYIGLNQIDQGISYFRDAYNKFAGDPSASSIPEFAGLALRYATALTDANRCPEAMPVLGTLLQKRLMPAHEMEARFRLGFCNAKTGNMQQARALFQDVVRRFPGSPFAANAALQLTRMGAPNPAPGR